MHRSFSNIKILRTTASLIIITFVGYFIVDTLQANWHSLEGKNLYPNWQTISATLLFAFAVIVSGFLWGEILTRLTGNKVTKMESARVQISSWLLKYIPGQVGSFASKLVWAKKTILVAATLQFLLSTKICF